MHSAHTNHAAELNERTKLKCVLIESQSRNNEEIIQKNFIRLVRICMTMRYCIDAAASLAMKRFAQVCSKLEHIFRKVYSTQ